MCVLPANAKDEKKIAWESIRGGGEIYVNQTFLKHKSYSL